MALLVGLILLEPDFGTAMSFAIIAAVIAFGVVIVLVSPQAAIDILNLGQLTVPLFDLAPLRFRHMAALRALRGRAVRGIWQANCFAR